MLPFFWYMLKVIICSGILVGYYWFFLRNKILYRYNRFYLLAAMSLSLLLPLLKINFWQPATEQNQAIRVLQAVSAGDEYMNNIVLTAQKTNWSPEQLYLVIYLLVSFIFFLVMLRSLFLIRSLLKRYPVQQVEDIAIVNTDDDSTPFSFLKYIFWNNSIDIDTTTGRQIFKHEVAHIQEKHTHDKLFLNIVLIFCWCNPFFWLYRKELNMIHEFIADKKAVEDSDTSAFAAMILQAAYPKHHFVLTNNFFYSPIKRRLMMLTKNKNPRVNYLGRIMVLPLAVLVFAAFTFKARSNSPLYHGKKITIDTPNTIQSQVPKNDTFPSGMFINVKHADSNYSKSDEFKNKALVIVDSIEIGNVGNNFVERSAEKYSTVVIYNPKEAQIQFGVKGKYGVIKLTQKDATFISANTIAYDKENGTIKLSGTGSTVKGDLSNSLIYLEDKIISPQELNNIPSEKISTITVLKGDRLNDIVDAKGKTSVIYISLKADDLPEVIISNSRNKANTLTLSAHKSTLTNENKDLTMTGNVNIIGDLSNTSIYVDDRLITEKVFKTINPKHIESINIKTTNTNDRKAMYITLKKIAGPFIFWGPIAGGWLELEYFKKQKELRIAPGYTFQKAILWFSGPGFGNSVVKATINSNSLAPVEKYIAQCEEGAKVVFDDVIITDEKGNIIPILYPPIYVAGILNRNQEDMQPTPIGKSETKDKNLVFSKAEVNPQFIGGQEAWRKFLRANLKINTPVENGAKLGIYKVVLKFIVNIDGSLSDIKCENDPGYGICSEAIRFIKSTPAWEPAIQNGKKVNAYMKQPITFVVEE